MSGGRPRFASVVIDVDSTLSGIEGIDWLAALRGPEMAARIADLTDRAMRGETTLDSVYGERLKMIAPTRREVDALGARYVEAIAPGAEATIGALRHAGVAVAVVSGGLREALTPLARFVGVGGQGLSAVSIRFDAEGNYAGYDERSPLATQQGKAQVVRELALGAPARGVGGGGTDLARRPVLPAFVAYSILRGRVGGFRGKLRFAALALPLMLVITATYHLGYPQYREDGVGQPELGNTIISLPMLATANPIGSVVAHVTMHTTAVTHTYETPTFLPPETESK